MGRLRAHNRPNRRLLAGPALALALCALYVAGCASTPKVGVRSDYRGGALDSSSVTPFFSRSSFSLSDGQLDRRLDWAEQAAVSWLSERGVQLSPPDEVRSELEDADAWGDFEPSGIFTVDLAASFESAPREERRQTQTSVLHDLFERDLAHRYVLFGELLYQTTAECRELPDRHTRRSRVVVTDDAPESLPRACVVTHFQARLVDASTGATVWYNRTLRELHAAEIDRAHIRRNIRATVRRTLAGDGGLSDLVETPGGSS